MFRSGQRHGVRGPVRAVFILRSLALVWIVVAVACLFLLVVRTKPTIAVIQATTEFVSCVVVVPDLAQIRLAGYALSYEAAGEPLSQHRPVLSPTTRRPLCLTGILTPTPGTHISYRRYGTDPVAIILERADDQPAASFGEAAGDVPSLLAKASWIRLDASADDNDDDNKSKTKTSRVCPGYAATRLPLYGQQVRVGTQLRPESGGAEPGSGLLITGTIDLFAKSIVRQFWDGATRIYPTSVRSMTIPPGSQISEFVAKDENPTNWAGYAKLDKDEALDVRVTTPATSIAILRPGIGLEPEILSASLFAQLENDPTLLSLQILAVLLSSISVTASSVLDWYAKYKQTSAEEAENGAAKEKPPVAAPPPKEEAKKVT